MATLLLSTAGLIFNIERQAPSVLELRYEAYPFFAIYLVGSYMAYSKV
jgi:hypothetical protein